MREVTILEKKKKKKCAWRYLKKDEIDIDLKPKHIATTDKISLIMTYEI